MSVFTENIGAAADNHAENGDERSAKRVIERLDIDRDFDSFLELLRLSFGGGVTADKEMYKWYLDMNPYNFGGKNMLYVMKEGERVIAADGLFPFELYSGERVYKSAHSVLSMTHPDYKRQGIFRAMTENSLRAAAEAGIDIVLGLANKNSFGAYKKFGWQTLFEKRVFIRPVHIYGRLRRKLKVALLAGLGAMLFYGVDFVRRYFLNKRGGGYGQLMFDSVPREAAECFDKYKRHYGNMIARDFVYLDYRYNKRPDKDYKTLVITKDDDVEGFAVLRLCPVGDHSMVSVAEFFCNPADAAAVDALISAVLKFAFERAAEYIVVCVGGVSALSSAFAKAGFSVNQKPLINNMMIAYPVSDIDGFDLLTGAERWYISQGDGETELHF